MNKTEFLNQIHYFDSWIEGYLFVVIGLLLVASFILIAIDNAQPAKVKEEVVEPSDKEAKTQLSHKEEQNIVAVVFIVITVVFGPLFWLTFKERIVLNKANLIEKHVVVKEVVPVSGGYEITSDDEEKVTISSSVLNSPPQVSYSFSAFGKKEGTKPFDVWYIRPDSQGTGVGM